MEKETAQTAGGISPNLNFPNTFIEAGKDVVQLSDAFSAKVSCDIFKYLSMKGFHTYFVDHRDRMSFRALCCKPLGFKVVVTQDDAGASGHVVRFFLNDATRHNPYICADERPWRVMGKEGETCKMEPLVSLDDEMKVRAIASNAFNALKCAFSKKAEAELSEMHFQFGKPTFGCSTGKLVLSGVVTSKECMVAWGEKIKKIERRDSHLSLLTEKLFL